MTDSDAQREPVFPDSDERVDQFDVASHERTEGMEYDMVYEQGPSFVENERPTDRLTEMPAWLQSFAASEQSEDLPQPERSTPAAGESVVFSAPATVSDAPDDSLPDWLRAEPAHAQQATLVDTTDAFDDFQQEPSEGADSFISEDDLPDWLRAFSHETAEQPAVSADEPSTQARVVASGSTTATAVRVPPVENVWLSSYDRQALGPGRTLFALLASNTALPVESNANGTYGAYTDVGEGAPRSGQSSGLVTSGASPAPAGIADASTSADKPRNTTRLISLTLLIVVLLVVVSFSVLG